MKGLNEFRTTLRSNDRTVGVFTTTTKHGAQDLRNVLQEIIIGGVDCVSGFTPKQWAINANKVGKSIDGIYWAKTRKVSKAPLVPITNPLEALQAGALYKES